MVHLEPPWCSSDHSPVQEQHRGQRHLQPPLPAFLLVSSLTPPGTEVFLGGRGFGSRGKSEDGSSLLLKGVRAALHKLLLWGRYILGANFSCHSQHPSPGLGHPQLSPKVGIPRLRHSSMFPPGLWGSGVNKQVVCIYF